MLVGFVVPDECAGIFSFKPEMVNPLTGTGIHVGAGGSCSAHLCCLQVIRAGGFNRQGL